MSATTRTETNARSLTAPSKSSAWLEGVDTAKLAITVRELKVAAAALGLDDSGKKHGRGSVRDACRKVYREGGKLIEKATSTPLA